MITAAQTREEIAKVFSLIATARRLLSSGALVDLRAIEERVTAVCGAVRAMPKEDGQGLVDERRAGHHRGQQAEQGARALPGSPADRGGPLSPGRVRVRQVSARARRS